MFLIPMDHRKKPTTKNQTLDPQMKAVHRI